MVSWGDQSQCDAFRADGDGARTIWYLSKALNYVMKDTARAEFGGRNRPWEHLARLEVVARSMRCSVECVPASCPRRVHSSYGARSHVVSASRRTRHRTGWSFTGLTRTVQRQLRRQWIDAQEAAAVGHLPVGSERIQLARENAAVRARTELICSRAAFP